MTAVVCGTSGGNPDELTATTAAGNPLRADLIVYDIYWVPSQPLAGEGVTIYFVIKNDGAKDVKNTYFANTLAIDGSVKAQRNIKSLSVGESVACQYSTTLSAATYQLKALTDRDNVIKESNENNNDRTEYMTVLNAGMPDLIGYDIWTSPAAPVSGQSATIYATVRNQGTGAASGTFYNRLYADGGLIATQTLTSLAAGTTGASWSAARTLGPGYHTLLAVADATNTIAESVETNNQRTENTWWLSPDLIVTSITVYNDVTGTVLASVYSGWPIEIRVVVKNNGDTTAAASTVELQDILSGVTTSMGTMAVPQLSAGSSATLIFDGKYLSSTGTHTLRAIADKNGVVAEANKDTGSGTGTGETNNNYDKAFTVNLSDWTVAVYMDADEFLDDPLTLEAAAIGDIEEMKLAGSQYGDLNVIVMLDMYDGEGAYQFPGARVYLVMTGSIYQLADLGEVNMGDPLTLRDFMGTYSLKRFKSTQSMLVLWDHGGGCVGGMFGDEHIVGTADNTMTVPEIGTAVKYDGVHIDILAMDACLMSSLEVGFEMSRAGDCDIIAGYEDYAYHDGFPYGCSAAYTDGIFNYIRSNPTATDAQVAYQIVDRTYRSYQSGGSQDAPDDHDQYLAVTAWYNYYGAPGWSEDIAYELYMVGYILRIDQEWTIADSARSGADDFGSYMYPPLGWSGFYVDVYDIARRIQIYADYYGNWDLYYSCQDVMDEVLNAVILAKYGYEHPLSSGGGMTVFFPEWEGDYNAYSDEYAALKMSSAMSAWYDFLEAYTWP